MAICAKVLTNNFSLEADQSESFSASSEDQDLGKYGSLRAQIGSRQLDVSSLAQLPP
jgi:hypothetical protein